MNLLLHHRRLATLFIYLLVGSTNLLAQFSVLNQQVEFDYTNTTLKSIIHDLETKYGIKFTYKIFDMDTNKSIQYSGRLGDGLDELFVGENIEYKAIGNGIILRQNRVIGQRIKGIVIDHITKIPLIGATISILNISEPVGTTTNLDGRFEIGGLYIGRYNLQIQYLGYEALNINQVLISSGKEVQLHIELKESILSLNEVVVVAKTDNTKPLNDMSNSSARSFSVEETQRYAAAISDPARMAQSFAGVSSGGDDLSNEILIRGNSARGLLWRLEGVEIPNPNHFSGYVSGGGAISMLSASTLADSDFYTGAFPAEFGNALSGVFDLSMRSGNSDKFEHSIAIGNIGLEASSEGYFSKKSDASYLVNFRYSTLELIDQFLPTLQGSLPAYKDLSFKINIPTLKLGTFSFFGLGGDNLQASSGIRDSTQWYSQMDDTDIREEQGMGLIGLTHRKVISSKAYFRSSLLVSGYRFMDLYEKLFPEVDYSTSKVDGSSFINKNLTFATQFNHKINAQHAIRTGLSINRKSFDYFSETIDPKLPLDSVTPSIDKELLNYLENKGSTYYSQVYFQWRYRLSETWELNAGINMSIFWLNKTVGVDPRIGLKNYLSEAQTLTFSLGLHSKPEHSSTYFLSPPNTAKEEFPNLNLRMMKAVHSVLGYDYWFSEKLRFKVEAYFQYLFDIPVSNNIANGFSILNSEDIFGIIFGNDLGEGTLINEGRGINFGLDMTFEKFFSEGYYFLMTSSIFDSKYSPLNRKWYHTYTANNFIFNLLGGKEWLLKKRSKNILGINGKFTYYGGRRDNPIDLAASREAAREVQIPDSYYSEKVAPYIRFDLGLVYRINGHKTTHSFHLSIQNLFNRYNVGTRYYDHQVGNILEFTQNGLIPFFTYRIQFSGGDK